MIAANVCGGMNASGVRRRMCRSTLPSRSAISSNDRTRPNARSSIQDARLGYGEENSVSGLSFQRRLGLGLMQNSFDGRERCARSKAS